MNLLQQIKDASLDARKTKHPTASFLVTLYSEAAIVGKNKRNGESTDEEVISVLKKFKAGAETMLQVSTQHSVVDQANIEIDIIDQYLPKMMDEDELRNIIADMVAELPEKSSKQMGTVMASLKYNFAGLYNGSVASRLVKEALN